MGWAKQIAIVSIIVLICLCCGAVAANFFITTVENATGPILPNADAIALTVGALSFAAAIATVLWPHK
jgi:hypothetical protein